MEVKAKPEVNGNQSQVKSEPPSGAPKKFQNNNSNNSNNNSNNQGNQGGPKNQNQNQGGPNQMRGNNPNPKFQNNRGGGKMNPMPRGNNNMKNEVNCVSSIFCARFQVDDLLQKFTSTGIGSLHNQNTFQIACIKLCYVKNLINFCNVSKTFQNTKIVWNIFYEFLMKNLIWSVG